MASAPEPLTAEHELAAFRCGKPALDHWLKTRALRNQQRGFTVVMVSCVGKQVVGYYGLAPTAVAPDVLPRRIRTGQPPDPIPCLLLGQLAVDQAYAGQGIGSGLLRHALNRCMKAAELIGGRAVLVNAVDQDAADYWRGRGFTPSRDDAFTLYRSVADIAASIQAGARHAQP